MGSWFLDRLTIVLAALLLITLLLTLASIARTPGVLVERYDWRWISTGPGGTPSDAPNISSEVTHYALRHGALEATGLERMNRPPEPVQTDRTFYSVDSAPFTSGGTAGTFIARSRWIYWPIVLIAGIALWPLILRARRRRRRTGLTRWQATREWIMTVCIFAAELFTLAAVTFCIRSYPYFERFDWRVIRSPAALQVNSSMGSLMLAWTESGPNHSLPGQAILFTRSTIPPTRGPLFEAAELKPGYRQALGFTVGTDGTTSLWQNVIVLPYWFVILLLLATTYALSHGEYLRRRSVIRSRIGLCRQCGYDLRGGQGERCPECGEPICDPPTLPKIAA